MERIMDDPYGTMGPVYYEEQEQLQAWLDENPNRILFDIFMDDTEDEWPDDNPAWLMREVLSAKIVTGDTTTTVTGQAMFTDGNVRGFKYVVWSTHGTYEDPPDYGENLYIEGEEDAGF